MAVYTRLPQHNLGNLFQEAVSTDTLSTKHLAVIGPYGTADGVAEYSRALYAPVADKVKEISFLASKDYIDILYPDNANIHRVWERKSDDISEIMASIAEHKPQLVHFQLHAEYFSLATVAELVSEISQLGIKVFITPHTVINPHYDLRLIKNALIKAKAIFVHRDDDLLALQRAGFTNARKFVHPYWEYPQFEREQIKDRLGLNDYYPIIATHGLMTPHKGLLETAEAVAKLKLRFPHILWLAINAVNPAVPTSHGVAEALAKRVNELGLEDNVVQVPQFITHDAEIVTLLQAADVGVIPYAEVGESASGAARKFIGAELPSVATQIPVLAEFAKQFAFIPNNKPEVLAEGIEKLIGSKIWQETFRRACAEITRMYNWDKMAETTMEYYRK